MLKRCPSSTFIGIGRLDDWRWIINERQYANVIPSSSGKKHEDVQNDEVWGLVYTLSSDDERNLDGNELPAYGKEWLEVEFFPANTTSGSCVDTIHKEGSTKEMLVYVDRNCVSEDEPKEEYVYRMNMGIQDAIEAGVPEGYVQKVIRRFIPERKQVEGEAAKREEALRNKAEKQAEAFEDE